MSRSRRKPRWSGDPLGDYRRALICRNFAPATVDEYVEAARKFQRWFGRPPARTTRRTVRRYLAHLEQRGLHANTLNKRLNMLRGFLSVMKETGRLREDTCKSFRIRKRPPGKPPLLLSEETIGKLLAAASIEVRTPGSPQGSIPLRDRLALELLYGLGLRRSEIRALRVVDLNLAEGTVLVRRAKGGKSRVLPLPPSSVPHLRRYLDEARPRLAKGRDRGRLLLTKDGCPLGRETVGRIVERVALRAGVRAHPHAFRRAVITHLTQAGVPVPMVQKFVGHRRLSSTQHYVELGWEELRRAVEVLEK